MTFRLRLGRIRPKIAGILDDQFMAWLFGRFNSTDPGLSSLILSPTNRFYISRWETVR